jgi:orotate phosphoribosyltransferase
MTEMSLREQVRAIAAAGMRYSEQPFALASGELSNHFIDAKAAFSRGGDLAVACRAIAEAVAREGVFYDAVGGLTMGADSFSHGIALLEDKRWFVVRKQRKGRGTDQLVEGATLGPETRVLLVDDVVTTGGSIEQAYGEVAATGAQIVAAATLVDRGETARVFFESAGVPYVSIVTYGELGIPRVGAAGAGSSLSA